MYIYNHHSTGSFCLFPVIDHLKTPIRHLLIKISLVFVCYFVLLIIPYMIFQQDLGNILVFLCCACVLLSISKRNEPDASCISLCYADCMLSWFSFLCYLSYILVSSFIHMDKVQNFIQNP